MITDLKNNTICVGDYFIAKFDTGETYIRQCKEKDPDWNTFINCKSRMRTYNKLDKR